MALTGYGYVLPRTTAYTIIANEKNLLEEEIANKVVLKDRKSFHTKVDILSYITDYQTAKDNIKNHEVEPELLGKRGRPYLFHPSMYPELKMRLEEVIDIVGFGPGIVSAMVSIILKRVSRSKDDGTIFEPSIEWSRWFLRIEMGLVKRRVTSHTNTADEMEKQKTLHLLNLDHLAKLIVEDGLIYCTDEVGVLLQPEEVERWVKRGSKVVSSTLSKDKRAFTANIIANASGNIVTHHQIFEGKTDACLPAAVVRTEYEASGYLFSYSDNHWSNQKLKLVELSNIHSKKVLQYLS